MFSVTLDTREFDRALNDYMVFQKKALPSIINAKLMFIARNATMTTKAATKENIESDLRMSSKEFPGVPLAAILLNMQNKATGKRGLSGAAMARGVEKFINKRKKSVNFVRAGWKNAIIILENALRSTGEMRWVRRSQAPVNKETMKKRGTEKLGKATPARPSESGRAWGEMQNDVSNKDTRIGVHVGDLDEVKMRGLQQAIDKEVSSMRTYIENKLNPVHKEFNRKQGF